MKILLCVFLVCAGGGGAFAGTRDFNVRDYGAAGDGVTKDTAAVQAAIDACAENGGGRVVLPPGTYRTGSVYLKSHVEFHLKKGARLLGSSDISDYCDEKTYPQNWGSVGEGWGPQHLLLSLEQQDVSITGEGVVDGNGRVFFDMSEPCWVGVSSWRRGAYQAKGRKRPGQTIVFIESQDIRVEGVCLEDMTCWSCFFYGCERVRVKGVTIRNDLRHLNTDGFDVDCCRDVEISDCDIETGDDAFAIRGNPRRLKDKMRVCENIYIHDAKGRTSACGVRIGVGNGMIRHVRCENLDLTQSGSGLQLQCMYGAGTGGVDIVDVSFKDIRLCDVSRGICVLGGSGTPTARLENIGFENVVIDALHLPVLVCGAGRTRPRCIRLKNVLSRSQPRVVYNVKTSDGAFAYPGLDESVRLKACDDVELDGMDEMFENVRVPASVASENVSFMPSNGICAHQGYCPKGCGVSPNTIGAFKAAVAVGAEMIEFDVHPVEDGRILVFHDKKQLMRPNVPTFDEAIDCLPKSNIWINVHYNGSRFFAQEIARKIKGKERLHQVVFSATLGLVKAAREVVPELLACNMMRPKTADLVSSYTDEQCAEYIRATREAGCQFVQPRHVWAAKWSQKAHEAGIRVNCCPLGRVTPELVRSVRRSGVDFLFVGGELPRAKEVW